MKKFLVAALLACSAVGVYAVVTHSWRQEERQFEEALKAAKERSRARAKVELRRILNELD